MFALVTAAAVIAGPSNSVVLQNAANPNVVMPGAGLGTGCAVGGCRIGKGSDMVVRLIQKNKRGDPTLHPPERVLV